MVHSLACLCGQDACLTVENSMLCGRTNHFTNFAILLGGNNNAALFSNDVCSNAYVTGSFYGDLATTLSVAGFVMLLAIATILILGYTTFGNKVLYGPEGMRVRNLRTHSQSTQLQTMSDEQDGQESGFEEA
jgi:hypothetical protein